MIQFLKSLKIFIELSRAGFYFSGKTNINNVSHWGFYRFNFKKNISIFDIDFDRSSISSYYHIHGGGNPMTPGITLFRIDDEKK